MSIARRKITIQLVSLLDLMLVVMFLQFMELSERSRNDELRAAQALADIEQQRSELADQRRDAELVAERAFDQRDLVGQLASELFNLPDDTVAKLLRQRFPDNPPDADEIAAMQQEFRKLRSQRGQEVMKHLLTFNELRKRCDVWELYVSESGVTTIKTADEESSFRADTSQQFASRLFANYRALPQPKSLVLLVLSYGDVKASTYEAALSGLPLAIDRLQADAAGRSRFEYAVLGYDPRLQNSVRSPTSK